ncbi:MAG: alanine/ornithine racemase family PLP-dependent enzyme [Myxococcota bacterium]|nr:alanine/ornithine racemase family PLP-dependent enzyme [Myxococcota bacterium]
MGRPYLTIDLRAVERNARAVVALCGRHGIAVTGVTKCTCGSPAVARAMLRGGVTSIGESRMENVQRLRAAGVDAPLMMLRIPPLSRVHEVAASVDLSLNSELAVLAGLSEAAARRGRRHPVIVMVDLGDLREGVWPDDVLPFAREVLALEGIRLVGLGANLTCYGGVIPTAENMARLVRRAEAVEKTHDVQLPWLSGGNSSALGLIAAGSMPARINHVRIGEAILLGRETVRRDPVPGTVQDAFRLYGEVIERKEKPSMPIGPRGRDAFGRATAFEDRGERPRALVNLGREDVDVEGLTPVDGRLTLLGATSDYLVLDVGEARELRVGDEVAFAPSYGALLAAMDSEYVEKRYRDAPEGE